MFPCTQCGCCCRHLKSNPLYVDLDRGDGTCRYLQGNLCSIYQKRPLKCRIDESYTTFFSQYMSKEQYYQENIKYCKALQQMKEE